MDRKQIFPFIVMFLLPLAAFNLDVGQTDRSFLQIRKKRGWRELLIQTGSMLLLGIIGIGMRDLDTGLNLMSCHTILHLIWLEWDKA